MSEEQDTAAKSGKKLSALLVMGGVIIMGADTCCSPGCPRKRCIALVSQYQQHNVRRRTERDGDTALPGFTAG